MTDLLPGGLQPDSGDEDDSRRRAFVGLAVLGGLAALVVLLLVLIVSVFRGGEHGRKLAATSAPTSVTTANSATPSTSTVSSPSTPPTTPRASSSASPRRTGNPCPSSTACPLPGDDGGVVAALNNFRTRHGLATVPGRSSPQAQQCALAQGDGPACASHFAWETVSKQDGAQVISLIVGRNADWLLDRAMTSVSVGWAYVPGTGQYECAIFKTN